MKRIGILLLVGLSCLLAACGSSKEEDALAWMEQERQQTKPHVSPITAPKQFQPEPYNNADAVDPFSNLKLTQALKRDDLQAASNGTLVAPELRRRKETLESFPLDTMVLVGSIFKAGQPVALVKVDKLLYQVKPGNHLGLNYGRVIKISETEVTLREIVQDAVGEWVERTATLHLQEGSK
ncbi:MAG: pilus assembly protein PilP [Rhodoferax sp.]|nr:pilus assembly protein PilP [Rhodoferax sp.]